MRIILTILIFSIVAGCATYKGAGSQVWYDQRTAELEQARRDKTISEAEYQNAKNQIDQIRVDYLHRDSPASASFGFGWWH